MYSLNDIIELINKGENIIKDTVELELAEVMQCSYDDLIDVLDNSLCESWLPKLDSNYTLVDFNPGFYYASLIFNVHIEIDVEMFKNEYMEE